MDTPKYPPPKTDGEREVLKNLEVIRDQLLLLKRDRTTYIRSQDVMVLYERAIEQARKLNELRRGVKTEETRVDRVLDSCFQLLSLFFMTIGRNHEAPASYALTSTIRRLIDHLTEANLFTSKDLESMSHTLEQLAQNVESTSEAHSETVVTLLKNRIERCRKQLANLQAKLDAFAEPILTTYEKLISILRQMSNINTKKFNPQEIQKYKQQIKDLQSKQTGGQFLGDDGKPLKGSDHVVALLGRCLVYTDVVLEKNGKFPEQFKGLYDTLTGIRNELDKLSVTQAWSLREADLYDFQRQLDKIDESRVDGNWLDEQGRPAELYVQRTLLYLIRRSYAIIYQLMISSEPVSEALLPIYNQLQTLKRCLIEVKESGGVSSVRELYPYSMKLNSIDNMRVDGKFMVGEDIPEGQGSVTELLAECFDLNYELRVAAESETNGDAKDAQP